MSISKIWKNTKKLCFLVIFLFCTLKASANMSRICPPSSRVSPVRWRLFSAGASPPPYKHNPAEQDFITQWFHLNVVKISSQSDFILNCEHSEQYNWRSQYNCRRQYNFLLARNITAFCYSLPPSLRDTSLVRWRQVVSACFCKMQSAVVCV